ncbi:hypothetical protein [Streptomyces rubellomurinus]|uniref:Uncharacterized protein n=2 Tax=Streptomyces TaxID=1883 RepID=A0A0F2TH65_STRR3|nr:hypothetical protein [Streptomyces rubellomurinus]KJS61896.1 hypothetical protein VM95_12045 [Streptomyces rubellomurinus]
MDPRDEEIIRLRQQLAAQQQAQPVQVQMTQQAVTRQRMSGGELIKHTVLAFCTAGISLIWTWSVMRGKKSVTVYR